MSIFTPRKDSELPEAEPRAFQSNKFAAPRTVVASAVRVNMRSTREAEQLKARKVSDVWQQEAWEYYDLLGEVKYSAGLIAAVMSRINLYAAYVEDSAHVPSNVKNIESLDEDFRKDCMNLLYALETSNGGTSGLLRNLALNLFVVGECYLTYEPGRISEGQLPTWHIRSIDELVVLNKQYAIRPRKDSKQADYIKLGPTSSATRIWRPHPRYSDEADSSLRGLLELCDELLLLSRTSRATIRSRLNSGLLFVPDGLSISAESDGDIDEMADGSDDAFDDFLEQLIDAMTTPIRDESDASAVVPLVIRGAEHLGEKIKHIAFYRTFDQMHAQLAQDLLDRILAGLDIPKDIAQGLSGVKYSNAILIEESLYKAHIEPMILMIVDALTVGYLRPKLIEAGWSPAEAQRAVIWYDPSAITAKPSKSESATTGYEMGAISAEAWRRENGFSLADAPSELETAQRLAKEKGMLSEPLTEMLINSMIPADMMAKYRGQALEESDPEAVEALEQVLEGGDTEEEPTEEKSVEAAPPTTAPPGLLDP